MADSRTGARNTKMELVASWGTRKKVFKKKNPKGDDTGASNGQSWNLKQKTKTVLDFNPHCMQ